MKPKIAVVGGGVAGLTVAFELLDRSGPGSDGIELTCLEAADRPGGNIRTSHEEGFTYEWAANGFLDNVPATPALVRRLDLDPRLLASEAAAARRFVFRSGRMREVPTGPAAFLKSDIIPLGGKLRLLCEPMAWGRPDTGDESVFNFASRRIGPAAARILVDAMVSGVFAGDSRRLSLAACFPKMRRMEDEHGSLFRAMLAMRKSRGDSGGPAGPGGTLTSFRDGLQELTDALARRLGSSLKLNQPVERLSTPGSRGFRLHLRHGEFLDVDGVILACPAWHASGMIESLDSDLAAKLATVPSAGVCVVHLGFRLEDLDSAPDGFGLLVPRGEGPRILGVLFSSNIFRHRAPGGHALLTVMAGGAHDPAALELDDEALVRLVRRDVRTTTGVGAEPDFVRIIRHSRGIPQYEMGHPQRLAEIDVCVDRHPGLWLSGNSYRGIAINACVDEAPKIAQAALESLGRASATTH